MKPNLSALPIIFLFLLATISSCSDIIEPSISKVAVQAKSPVNLYQSSSYTINFWWDQVTAALSYHLQVVTPTFAAPGGLVLDTIVKFNKFSFNLNPGAYQWRVMAENGSSQTSFTSARSFIVSAGTIKQQSVQLITPANKALTNQQTANFQWSSLYGATKYQLEIDTNNFINESAAVYNQIFTSQQVSFTFPKDQVYQWRVRAENDTAQTQWSAVNTVTYDHTPPAVVILASPADASTVNSPVSLLWNNDTGAVNYKLYVYKSDGITAYNQSFPMVLTTTSYSFTIGSPGDKVYWMVTAIDTAGNESQASSVFSFVLQ